jgi:acetyl esterase/lipase
MGFMARTILALLAACAALAGAEIKTERNIIYGMYSGLALLMDVYTPEKPNGYGIVFIAGSGWHAPLPYSAQPLKDSGQVQPYMKALVGAGYTVFAIDHRAAPRFHYPAAVEDAQRAVRFVRYHAPRYGIDPDRIGAAGGSSGGHLVSMLGVLDGKRDTQDADPINRLSAKVLCVVARAAPSDLVGLQSTGTGATVSSFLDTASARDASPVNYVSADDPPILLMHGDKDATVPFAQSELMQAALEKAGVPVKLLRVPGGAHGPNFPGATNAPDYLGEMVRWFDRYLRKNGSPQ